MIINNHVFRINIVSLKTQFQMLAPQFIDHSQQDTQELLKCISKSLHADVNVVEDKPETALIKTKDDVSNVEKILQSSHYT